MISLQQHIEEKLKINKDFKHIELYTLEDIFNILKEQGRFSGGNKKPYCFTIDKKNNIRKIWDDIDEDLKNCYIEKFGFGRDIFNTYEEELENNVIHCTYYEGKTKDYKQYKLIKKYNDIFCTVLKFDYLHLYDGEEIIFVQYYLRTKDLFYDSDYDYKPDKSFYVPTVFLDKFDKFFVDAYNEKQKILKAKKK